MKLSKMIAEKYNVSVRSARDYIKNGQVSYNGSLFKHDKDVPDGEILLSLSEPDLSVNCDDFIISCHENIVFIEKPAFMHTERHKPDDPITVEDIIKKCAFDFYLISRLDYMTDGIIAAVRDGYSIKNTSKVYYAWVSGRFGKKVEIENLIDSDKRIKVRVTDKPGGNRTIFTPAKVSDAQTLVKAEFEQASRHQLRAYLAYLGYPIIGDNLYGGESHDRILLHCAETTINGITETSKTTDKFINIYS